MRLIDAELLKQELDEWALVIGKPQFYSREDAIYIIDTSPTINQIKDQEEQK